jgi:hypothetical protein
VKLFKSLFKNRNFYIDDFVGCFGHPVLPGAESNRGQHAYALKGEVQFNVVIKAMSACLT